MTSSYMQSLTADVISADYDISRTENESTKDFSIKTFKVAAGKLEDSMFTTALAKEGEILSFIKLKKNGDEFHIVLSNGKTIPFEGDLVRSGVTNVLYELAGHPDEFEIINIISDDVKECNITKIDINFQNKVIGNTKQLVITPDSIFDRDCRKCGGGSGEKCYCGSWSQNCYCD